MLYEERWGVYETPWANNGVTAEHETDGLQVNDADRQGERESGEKGERARLAKRITGRFSM